MHKILQIKCWKNVGSYALNTPAPGRAWRYFNLQNFRHITGFVVESGLGDYTVKGNLISRLAGKPVEVTGNITECSDGDMIEEKSIQKIEETLP